MSGGLNHPRVWRIVRWTVWKIVRWFEASGSSGGLSGREDRQVIWTIRWNVRWISQGVLTVKRINRPIIQQIKSSCELSGGLDIKANFPVVWTFRQIIRRFEPSGGSSVGLNCHRNRQLDRWVIWTVSGSSGGLNHQDHNQVDCLLDRQGVLTVKGINRPIVQQMKLSGGLNLQANL